MCCYIKHLTGTPAVAVMVVLQPATQIPPFIRYIDHTIEPSKPVESIANGIR